MSESTDKPPRRLRRLSVVWLGDGHPRYFLTICSADRQPVLANSAIHQRLAAFLGESPQRYNWWPTRYVMMPDHLHLLAAQGNESISLGAWVKALKAVVGQREFRWQTGFFDHVLRSDESESDKWEYVRQNPVRERLAVRAEDWPYAGEFLYENDGTIRIN